jgi:DegV family protein with EDD domain
VSIAVLTDSAAALPTDVAEAAGVQVVPLRITIGDASHRDGEVAPEEVVARASEGITTAGPAPADILAALEAVGGSSEGALMLTVARRLSGTYEAARLAASEFSGRARVLDTNTAAGAEGLVVLAAAAQALSGGTLEEVEWVARETSGRVHLIAALGSLDWLVRGGHVPEITAWAGHLLGLWTVFELRGGHIRPLRPARSEAAVIERIVSACATDRPPAGRLHVSAMYALVSDPADRLLSATREIESPATAVIGPFSPVMIAHTGPEVFGLAWWWEVNATVNPVGAGD